MIMHTGWFRGKGLFWEVIVSVILRKTVYTKMCLILNGYQDCTLWICKYKCIINSYYQSTQPGIFLIVQPFSTLLYHHQAKHILYNTKKGIYNQKSREKGRTMRAKFKQLYLSKSSHLYTSSYDLFSHIDQHCHLRK
jgi:hypothetical protein